MNVAGGGGGRVGQAGSEAWARVEQGHGKWTARSARPQLGWGWEWHKGNGCLSGRQATLTSPRGSKHRVLGSMPALPGAPLLACIHALPCRLLDDRQPPPCQRLAAQLLCRQQPSGKILPWPLAACGVCLIRAWSRQTKARPGWIATLGPARTHYQRFRPPCETPRARACIAAPCAGDGQRQRQQRAPAMTASSAAASATLCAMGPTQSREEA